MQRRRQKVIHCRQHAGEKPLHIGAAAAIVAAIALGQAERRNAPAWPSTGTTSVWPESITPPPPDGPSRA